MHEWALLIFTICVQAAAGCIFILWLFAKKIAKNGEKTVFTILKLPLVVAAGLSLIGLGASFAHLGAPGNAFNTIRHIGSSWMSREILMTGMFIGAACLTAGLAIVQKKVNPVLMLVSALIGLIDIYFMAAIYANTLVSGWDSLNTYTSFYGTAFVLGAVLAVSFTVPGLRKHGMDDAAKNLVKTSFIAALFGMAIQMVGIAVFPAAMAETNMINSSSAAATLAGYKSTIALRWTIEVIGLVLLGYLALTPAKKASVSVAFIALAVIAFAEGMSRYLFYVLGA